MTIGILSCKLELSDECVKLGTKDQFASGKICKKCYKVKHAERVRRNYEKLRENYEEYIAKNREAVKKCRANKKKVIIIFEDDDE